MRPGRGGGGAAAGEDDAMNIRRARLIYFSPTRTTKKIMEGISEGLQFETVESVDLTPPEIKTASSEMITDELVLLGAPVHSGRIPPQAVERIRRFQGLHTPTVVVVVYGNRAYDDALWELRDIAVAVGFRPIAGAAFIGEHSLADAAMPIALGRPDRNDLGKARKFGESIRKKLETMDSFDTDAVLQVPGKYPFRERTKRPPVSPITREDVCIKCGQCAEVCPVGAITIADTVVTDPTICLRCLACVKNCPTGARCMEDPGVRQAAKRLNETCSARKEPEIFMQ
jgi:ferredoxin